MAAHESFWIQSRAGKVPDPICALSIDAHQEQIAATHGHLDAYNVPFTGWTPKSSDVGCVKLYNKEYLELHSAKVRTTVFPNYGLSTVKPQVGNDPEPLARPGTLCTWNELYAPGFQKFSNGIVLPVNERPPVRPTEKSVAKIDGNLDASLTLRRLQPGYISIVRDQLIAVRPSPQSTPPIAGYSDALGFIVDYRDGKPTSLGEATYYTALAAVAFATFQFDPDEWARTNANAAIFELLSTLIEKGWGNEDSLGRKHPIRYPEEFDYDRRGQVIRARPLTKDSYGQIIAAAHYAHVCPNTSQEVKAKALQLLQIWVEYLSTNKWRTHSNYLADEFVTEKVDGKDVLKGVFGKGGARAERIGIESYMLQPHDMYALRNLAAAMFPSVNWNVWENLSSEMSQTITDVAAPYLGSLAGRAIDYALQQLVFSVNYDIPLGFAGWNFGRVKGAFSISIPADVRTKARDAFVETVTDAIKESVQASDPTNQQRLAEVVVNRILGILPPILAADTWKQVVGDIIAQVMPWVTGDIYMEAATFIATLSLLRINKYAKPYIVSYTSWVYIVECELRKDIMTLLGPFLSDFLVLLKDNGNPNGLWAWLSGDQDEVTRQLAIFESSPPNQWWQFAYGPSKFDDWLKDSRNIDPSDLRNSSSRLDYLLLEGLTRKGRPQGLPRIEFDPKYFIAFANGALDLFKLSVQKAFEESGQYARQWIDDAERTIVEIWKKPGSYTRNIIYSGRVVSTLLSTAGLDVEQWLYNADGSLSEYAKWFTDKVLTDAGLAERVLRGADGQLEHWHWAVDGALQYYGKWWTSGTDGAAKGVDMVEMHIRDIGGKLEITTWAVGNVFQSYGRWLNSAANGSADGVNMVEKRVRDLSGKLEITTWAAGNVFQSYGRWLNSAASGVADGINMVEKRVRDVDARLEINTWAVGGIFQSYGRWLNSAADGGADGANMVEKRVRDINGNLEITTWAVGNVFQSYGRWLNSAADGIADGINMVEKRVRDISAQLEINTWVVGGVFQSYGRWLNSAADGGANGIDMVEKRIRSAGGQFEQWLWTSEHVFQKYLLWSDSSAKGEATAEHIVEVLTQLADGSKVVEVWDSSRKYAKTVFDSVGRVISGVRIPLPQWPPKW